MGKSTVPGVRAVGKSNAVAVYSVTTVVMEL